MMEAPPRPVTVEELVHHPRECELVNGEVRVMTPTGGTHGSVTARLTAAIAAFVYDRGVGEVFAAETGFILARDPDTVRAPDIAFVRGGRIPPAGFPGFVPLAPDLAVETVSPDDRPGALRERVEQYLAAGIRIVWVVDPASRRVTVHAAGHPPHVVPPDGTLDGGDVLPGFSYQIARMFGSADRGATGP